VRLFLFDTLRRRETRCRNRSEDWQRIGEGYVRLLLFHTLRRRPDMKCSEMKRLTRIAADRSLLRGTLALSVGPESTSNVTAPLIKKGANALQSEN
jgi:hypothetical protein